MAFQDHFSGHASTYAAFRPTYPTELFDWLASMAPGRELAWDVGAGNGQASVGLGERFARVVATEPSAQQLANAVPHPHVEYREATYESGLPNHSAQLVTVGQAIHWFDLPAFFTEVRRVLVPGGMFAAFAYAYSHITPAIDAIVRPYHDDTMGPYWAPEHLLIYAGYRTLDLPIREIAAPPMAIRAEMRVEHFIGYLRSWSSAQKAIQAGREDLVTAFEARLRAVWGNQPRLVTWPLIVRAGPLA